MTAAPGDFLAFPIPELESVAGKTVTGDFGGGRISSDGGAVALAAADGKLGLVDLIASLFPDERDPRRVKHTIRSILLSRVMLIACGYEDGNDMDKFRHEPLFKALVGLPPSGRKGLASQPTICRTENKPRRRDLVKMLKAMVEFYCRTRAKTLGEIVIHFDDSFFRVFGAQRMSKYHAHDGGHGFKPFLAFDAATGQPIVAILRPAKTVKGREFLRYIRRMHEIIRENLPHTKITYRGDSHYCRKEVMDWIERQPDCEYIFNNPVDASIRRLPEVAAAIERCEREREKNDSDEVRGYCEMNLKRGAWKRERRVAYRVLATRDHETDVRSVVTSLRGGTAEKLYADIYCARANAENMIKLFKSQLFADRMSCMEPQANQFRLILHMVAHHLYLEAQKAIPAKSPFKTAEFSTMREGIVKVAARVLELGNEIRVSFASSFPFKKELLAILSALRAPRFDGAILGHGP